MFKGHLSFPEKVSQHFSSKTARPISLAGTIQIRDKCRCATCSSFWSSIKGREYFFLENLWWVPLCGNLILLQNGSSNIYLPNTKQMREECRCEACYLFWAWALYGFSWKSWNTLIFFPLLMGTTLWWLLLQNGSADVLHLIPVK